MLLWIKLLVLNANQILVAGITTVFRDLVISGFRTKNLYPAIYVVGERSSAAGTEHWSVKPVSAVTKIKAKAVGRSNSAAAA
jgi:hypothetical protein